MYQINLDKVNHYLSVYDTSSDWNSPRSEWMECKAIEESINKLFASDEVDRQTALDSYQRVFHALSQDPETQQALNIGLSKVWVRRMIYLEKSLEEKALNEKKLEQYKDDLRGMKLGCDAKDRELEKYREASENVWRESRREILQREEQERVLAATRKSLSEANQRADLYLTELLHLRKLVNKPF